MASLSQAKTLGGIGAIIALVGGFIHPLVGFIGVILLLLAVKQVSDSVSDPAIFTNYLLFFVVDLVATLLLVLFVGGAVVLLLSGGFFSALGTLLAGWVAFWALLLVGAFLLKKSYDAIAAKTGVKMFGTAALVYLIGAALTIVVVGLLVVLVAEILQIVAFFSLPDPPAPAAQQA